MTNIPKSAGRPKGSPNKITVTLKSRLQNFVDRKLESIEDEYDLLEPAERVKMVLSILPYLVPKLSAVAASIEVENRLQAMDESQLNEMINLILEQNDDDDTAE